MKESEFEAAYKKVRERDEKSANEQPIPEAEGINVWVVFGLSIGIASIVLAFITKYSVLFALVAMALSFIGYRKKRGSQAFAGMVCGSVGLILGIVFSIARYLIFVSVNGTMNDIMEQFRQLPIFN